MRLTNAELKPGTNGEKRELIARIRVRGAEKEPDPVRSVTPASAPAPKKESAPASAGKPVYYPPSVRKPEKKSVSFAPVADRCAFQLCRESEMKSGYHFGGADDYGTIGIDPSEIRVYQKSKGVSMAFGVIGSMVEGRGKVIASIKPEDILSFDRTLDKHRCTEYRIHLKDGRTLKTSFNQQFMINAFDQFLTQVPGGR